MSQKRKNNKEELPNDEDTDDYNSIEEDEESYQQDKSTLLEEMTEEALKRSQKDRKAPNRYPDQVFLTYYDAVTAPDRQNWLAAIQEERDALIKNKTWKLVNTTEAQGVKPLTSRWVFKGQRSI